jgi:hypothetical protein
LSANTGDFSSSVNAASHTVGTAFTANSTLVNAVALSLSTNVATIGTSATFYSNGHVRIGDNLPGIYDTVRYGIAGDTIIRGDITSTLQFTPNTDYGEMIMSRKSTTGTFDLNGAGTIIAGDYQFRITGQEKMRIAANGNVGIGNTTPASKLVVSGNVDFRTANILLDGVVSGGYYKGNNSNTINQAAAGNIFRVNSNTLTASVTFAAGENGTATGPVSVASGISLTIQTGARVSIV